MAYTKQTWTNDVTAITAERMTHIENGIYDNSLATDKINPSGTATTTTEIESGQINDVIGFKSLKLKGQTSQYTTTGKNIFDGVFRQGSTSATNATNRICSNNDLILTSGTTYTISTNLNLSNYKYAIVLSDVAFPHATSSNKYDSGWKTATFSFTPEGNYYFAITIGTTNGTDNITPSILNGIWFQLETGSSATSYEKYSGGKASPNPDFPQEVNNVSGDNVVNICNINLLDESKLRQGAYLKATNNTRLFIDSNNYLEVGTYTIVTNLDLTKFRYGADVASTPFPLDVGKPIDIFDAGWITNSNHLTFSITQRGYLGVGISKTNGSNNITPSEVADYWFMVYKGTYDSNITYTAHQGNNFDIDLPVENLFFLPDATITNGIEYTINNDGTFNVYGTASANTTISLLKDLTLTKIKANNYAFSVNQTLPVGVEIRVEGFNGNTWKRHLGGSPLNSSNSIKNGTADLTDVNKIRTSIYVPSGKSVDMKNVAVQFEKGSVINSFTPFGVTPIYLGKIGTYADYIFKKDGKWWKHKEVEKITLNGSETPTINTALTNTTRALYSNILPHKSKAGAGSGICNLLPYYENWVNDVEGFYLDNNTTNLVFRINKSTVGTTITSVNNFLSENNMTVYYIVETAIEEEITYTPLIRQLDEVYNSGLYDVTNISQDNSSEAFILDLEACKNNINGIVEYIRR